MLLKPPSFYADHNINLRLGKRVTGIEPVRRCITVANDAIEYDNLVLATGSNPRRLPERLGGALRGVHVIRTITDIDALRIDLDVADRVLVVGGGYVGLEASAVACKLGKEVTLIEMAPRILQRVACRETSDFFRRLHHDNSVRILEGVRLTHLIGSDQVTGAKLDSGAELAVDTVIVGIGIDPEISLAQDAGLQIENGVRVDAFGRTSFNSIWAAGDCASFPHGNQRVRLESVPNAIDHAECIADNILGKSREYQAKPWFWSDQFDVKLQIAGLHGGYDSVMTRQTDKSLSVWYYRAKSLLAVDAMNDPRSYMVGKRMIEAGASPAKEAISDIGTDLKSILQIGKGA